MSASHRLCLLKTSDRACFEVLETVASYHALVGHICLADSLPGCFSFDPQYDFTEDLVVVSTQRITHLETALSMFRLIY